MKLTDVFVLMLLAGCASWHHTYSPYMADDEFVQRQDMMEAQLDNAGAHHELLMVPQVDGHYNIVFRSTNVVDVTPLEGMPIEQLELPFERITNGIRVLRNMPHVTRINGKDAATFWKTHNTNSVAQHATAN